jgi:predicted transposase/invertase (TIGR01784 family)
MQGIEQGREEGLAEGLEKGIQQGRAEGIAAVARKMLSNGMDAKTVAEITGMHIIDVEKLA